MGGCLSSPNVKKPLATSPRKVEAKPRPDFGIAELYAAVYELGRGAYGEIWLCKEIATKRPVAIKFLKRPIYAASKEMVVHEIKTAGDLGRAHMNIVRTHKVLLSRSHLAIVMEFAKGGTLTKYVTDKFSTKHERNGLCLDEVEACYIFWQFIHAVEVCHQHHVAHRDLKLDNTLLDGSTPPRVKLCDFGFAKSWEGEDRNMLTRTGTLEYMPPEVISLDKKRQGKGYDGAKADVWASGVLLTVMLLGCFPFEHGSNTHPNSSAADIEIWLQQIRGSWRDHKKISDLSMRLSAECRDLLDKILTLDGAKRLDIAGIKAHPWFTRSLPAPYEEARQKLIEAQNLLSYRNPSPDEVKKRNEELANLVSLATKEPEPEEAPVHQVDML